MKTTLYRITAGICLSCATFCGCSDGGSSGRTGGGGPEKAQRDKTAEVALEMFDRWVGSVRKPRRESRYEPTPEEELGLRPPMELAAVVLAWAKDKPVVGWYRASRRNLALVYKSLIEDFKVRKDSGMGPTGYTNDLRSKWNEAFRSDCELRRYMLECYSSKKDLPLPETLERAFAEPERRAAQLQALVKDAQNRSAQLERTASSLKSRFEAAGKVSWSQRKTSGEWSAASSDFQAIHDNADRIADAADDFASRLRSASRGVDPANDAGAACAGLAEKTALLKKDMSAISHSASLQMEIANSQIELAQCETVRTTLETEISGVLAMIDKEGAAAWSDEKAIKHWETFYMQMEKLTAQADSLSGPAAALVRSIEGIAGRGEAAAAAAAESLEKAKRLMSAAEAAKERAEGQATIAKGKIVFAKAATECVTLDRELADLETALEVAEAVSWADTKTAREWEALRGPAAEFSARAEKARVASAALAGRVASVVRSAKGDKTAVAFGERISTLAASLAASAGRAKERMEVIDGQIPFSKFSGALKMLAEAIVKVHPALGRKKSRMAEIAEIENLIRSSKSRGFSDLDALSRRAAEIKTRALSERAEELGLGRRARKLLDGREAILGENAMYRLGAKIACEAGRARIKTELAAFRLAAGAGSEEALRGRLTNIESEAFCLSDSTDEDSLLKRMDDTLNVVKRLYERERGRQGISKTEQTTGKESK